jgi:hypothetical protein
MTAALLALVAAATSGAGSGCTNPVRDKAIEDLGPEAPGESPGPEHRAGQPCLLCHSDGGPASSKPFAMAGTVYQDAKGLKGAENVFVQFVDARGSGPVVAPQTGPSGNFYVPLQDWADLSYPVRVGLYEKITDKPKTTMKSLIGREGSCNFCHRPLPDGDLSDDQIDKTRSSAGAITF